MTVTVTPVNDEPVVIAGPDRSGVEGSPVNITGSTATDVDGPFPLAFHWEILDGPDVSEEPTGTFADADDPRRSSRPSRTAPTSCNSRLCDADPNEFCATPMSPTTPSR